MRIYWLEDLKYGQIGMMARPRGNDWLETDIRILSRQGVQTLVCLMEQSELKELGLEDEWDYCDQAGIRFVHFPIVDRNVPEDDLSFLSCVKKLDQELKDGKKIVLHCRMGVGRTGMLTGSLLLMQGYRAEGLFRLISRYRNLEVPDSDVQKQWVIDFGRRYINEFL